VKEIGNLRIFGLKEVSEKLVISEQTLMKKLRAGDIKGQKVGNEWFISEKSLEIFFMGFPKPKTKIKVNPEENRRAKMKEVGKKYQAERLEVKTPTGKDGESHA